MADYTYPTGLRLPLQSNYSREESARFQASSPASGPYFTQIITDDAPVYVNLSWTFTASEALAFRAWLRQDNFAIMNGASFNMPVSIEGGLQVQTCYFTPDGVPQMTSETQTKKMYQAKVMVRKLDEFGEGSEDLIIGAIALGEFELLDQAINKDYPEE